MKKLLSKLLTVILTFTIILPAAIISFTVPVSAATSLKIYESDSGGTKGSEISNLITLPDCSTGYYWIEGIPANSDVDINLTNVPTWAYIDLYSYDLAYNQDVYSSMPGDYTGEDVDITLLNTGSSGFLIEIWDNECAGDVTGLTLTAEYHSPALYPVELANGVASDSRVLSVPWPTDYSFTIPDVPVGTDLTVTTTASAGDVGITVNGDNSADTCSADADPGPTNADETCTIDPTTDDRGDGYGDFTVTLDVYQHTPDFTITADFTGGSGPVPVQIYNGQDIVYKMTGTAGTQAIYKIDIPAGGSDLFVTAEQVDTSQVELYVKEGSQPAFDGTDDCATTAATDPDECDFTGSTTPNTSYYIGIEEGTTTSYEDEIDIFATFINGSLTNGVPVTGLSVTEAPDEWLYYDIEVAHTQGFFAVQTEGTCGNGTHNDLYTINNDLPFTDYYYTFGGEEGRSETDDSCSETIWLSNPPDDYFGIGLYGPEGDFSGVTLSAGYGIGLGNGGSHTRAASGGDPGIPNGEYQYYLINPTNVDTVDGRIAAITYNGTNEIDLYHGEGYFPTTGTYDNRSINAGNAESIVISSPVADYNTFGVYANGADVDNAAFAVNWTNDVITNGVDLTGLTVPAYQYTNYIFNVPSGVVDMDLTASGQSDDSMNMYVKYDNFPSWSTPDGSDTAGGATKSISIPGSLSSGEWIVSLYNPTGTDITGVTLSADYTDTYSYNGTPTQSGAITNGNWEYFKVNIPLWASDLEVTTSGGTGTSADLYVEYGSQPTLATTDKSTNAGTNNETVTIASPSDGDYYIGIYANGGDVDAVDLNIRFINRVLDGDTESNIDIAGDEWAYFKWDLPANRLVTSFSTYPTADPVHIYVKEGDFPTDSDYDWMSDYTIYGQNGVSGWTEQVEILDQSAAATYYIGIKGTTQSDNLQLLNHYVVQTTSQGTWTDKTVIHDGNEIGVRVAADGNNIAAIQQDGEATNNILVNFYKNRTLVSQVNSGISDYGGIYDESALAIDGNYAVLGLSLLTNWGGSGYSPGGIFIFKTTDGGNSWSFDQQIIQDAVSAHSNARFGQAVAISGDYIFVGEPGYDTLAGAVYVYKRNSGTGVWEYDQSIAPTGLVGQPRFGNAVDVDGDYAIIGGENYAGQDGVVRIYQNVAGTWTQDGTDLNAEADFDRFGWDVAIDGTNERALIGAYGYGSNGKAYFYDKTGGVWTEGSTFTGDEASIAFGYSVDIDGDYGIVGTYPAYPRNGYANVYTHNSPWTLDNKFQQSPGEEDNTYGMDVAISGGSTPTVVIADTGFSDSAGEPFGFMFFFTEGSSGGAVPEFSDYLLFLTVIFALYLMIRIVPKLRGGTIAKT